MCLSFARRCLLGLTAVTLALLMTSAAYAQANLAITNFQVSPTFDIDANGNLTYTATVQNTGTADATNVVVTFTLTGDDLPISPSPSGGCLFTPGATQLKVVCTLSTLAHGGGTQDFTVVVHPTDTAPRDATVEAQADGVTPVSDFVTSNIIEVGLSEMRVTLTSTNPGKVGEPLVYNVTVFNIQDDSAANVYAVLVLPKLTTFVSATKGCSHGTLVICKLGSMAPGTGKTVGITVLPTVAGWTQATAGVRLTTPDRDPTNNSAATSIWVNP